MNSYSHMVRGPGLEPGLRDYKSPRLPIDSTPQILKFWLFFKLHLTYSYVGLSQAFSNYTCGCTSAFVV